MSKTEKQNRAREAAFQIFAAAHAREVGIPLGQARKDLSGSNTTMIEVTRAQMEALAQALQKMGMLTAEQIKALFPPRERKRQISSLLADKIVRPNTWEDRMTEFEEPWLVLAGKAMAGSPKNERAKLRGILYAYEILIPSPVRGRDEPALDLPI